MFQSTLPTRGSDDAVTYTPQTLTVVSIHAPHEGERRLQHRHAILRRTVSIHAPHEGERPPLSKIGKTIL